MPHDIGVGCGTVENKGPGFRQNLQLLPAIARAVGQAQPRRENLRRVVHQKLYVAAIGVRVQRHAVFAGDAVHFSVVANVGLVAFIRPATHTPRRHNAGPPGMTAVEPLDRLLRRLIGGFRFHQNVFR